MALRPGSSEAAADGALDTVRLVPIRAAASRPQFPLTHLYVELVYGPLLGPAALLVARHLGRTLHVSKGPVAISLATLAIEVGLRAGAESPLGRRSHLRKAIDRLEHVHIVQWMPEGELGVLCELPAVGSDALAKLPSSAVQAHRYFLSGEVESSCAGP